MEGLLFKRGREDSRFQPRKFVLNETEDTLKYYVKENHKEPKAIMKISQLNATFCPSKIGNPNGLQITCIKDGSTRSIFVYSEDGKVKTVECTFIISLTDKKGCENGLFVGYS